MCIMLKLLFLIMFWCLFSNVIWSRCLIGVWLIVWVLFLIFLCSVFVVMKVSCRLSLCSFNICWFGWFVCGFIWSGKRVVLVCVVWVKFSLKLIVGWLVNVLRCWSCGLIGCVVSIVCSVGSVCVVVWCWCCLLVIWMWVSWCCLMCWWKCRFMWLISCLWCLIWCCGVCILVMRLGRLLCLIWLGLFVSCFISLLWCFVWFLRKWFMWICCCMWLMCWVWFGLSRLSRLMVCCMRLVWRWFGRCWFLIRLMLCLSWWFVVMWLSGMSMVIFCVFFWVCVLVRVLICCVLLLLKLFLWNIFLVWCYLMCLMVCLLNCMKIIWFLNMGVNWFWLVCWCLIWWINFGEWI